jgi:hypothetical protein
MDPNKVKVKVKVKLKAGSVAEDVASILLRVLHKEYKIVQFSHILNPLVLWVE